jgi:hypothetical protein
VDLDLILPGTKGQARYVAHLLWPDGKVDASWRVWLSAKGVDESQWPGVHAARQKSLLMAYAADIAHE